MRERIDIFEDDRLDETFSRSNVDQFLKKINDLIERINAGHSKVGNKLINHYNWTQATGWLLLELQDKNELKDLDLDQTIFTFEDKELDEILNLVRDGQSLYNIYREFIPMSFLNPTKLVGENPFLIEQNINLAFKDYENKFHHSETSISIILQNYKENADLLDLEKTSRFIYRFSTLFIKQRAKIIKDQEELVRVCP